MLYIYIHTYIYIYIFIYIYIYIYVYVCVCMYVYVCNIYIYIYTYIDIYTPDVPTMSSYTSNTYILMSLWRHKDTILLVILQLDLSLMVLGLYEVHFLITIEVRNQESDICSYQQLWYGSSRHSKYREAKTHNDLKKLLHFLCITFIF